MARVADISRNKLEIVMALYNLKLINYQMNRLGFDAEQLAKHAHISLPTAHCCIAGRLGTLRLLKQVADALKIKWEYITNVDLPEKVFHRAVLTNGDRTGRTVKTGPVFGSANRPRSKELRA